MLYGMMMMMMCEESGDDTAAEGMLIACHQEPNASRMARHSSL